MIQSKADIVDDLRGALIGYENLLTVNAGADPAPEALTPNTWERWRPAAGAVLPEWEIVTPTSIDFVALAAHNLAGQTFTIEYSSVDGGAKTVIESLSPTDNKPILLQFDPVVVKEIHLLGTFTAGAELGVIYAGNLLRMQRNIYGGHTPMTLAAKTEFRSPQSETGQFLSREVTSQGSQGSFSWQFLDPDWYREKFQPFVNLAKTKPFFISWRPDMYSDEIVFGHTTDDIAPVNTGGGNTLMSVGFSMNGHEDL